MKRITGSGSPYSISKRHQGRRYLYWWDIWPMRKQELAHAGEIHFLKKDTGEEAVVKAEVLVPFLVEERLTTRGKWGIKILRDRQEELAIEPGKCGTWEFLHV